MVHCTTVCVMPTTDELLGAAEVCSKLGISRNTLMRRIDEGLVPVVGKLPGKHGAFVFRATDIAALAESGVAAVTA
jgi:predicted DNA-binding transcriptional regulator AlpA